MKKGFFILFVLLGLARLEVYGQCNTPVCFGDVASIPSGIPGLQHYMTSRRDTSETKPYLYIACKEQGLLILDISNIGLIKKAAAIQKNLLNNLDVMNITQAGNYLYLALGDNFSPKSQSSGMAIIDVTHPYVPKVMSVFTYPDKSGSGYVAVKGNYAYLAAMQNGIIVLDISDKSYIRYVTQFKPDINFPVDNPSSSDQLKINARSLILKKNLIYLCEDAGGVRIIKLSANNNMTEIGKYSNPSLEKKARAYNNLVLKDTLLYVAADYAGMEVLNVKDPSNIKQVSWWNPWKAETAENNWFNSQGYSNEIDYDASNNIVFMSAGRTDLVAVDVSRPALPTLSAQYGSTSDKIGAWGVSRYKDQLYLSYISTWPLYIPYKSDWSGVKILSYTSNSIKN